jgi:hypothetical protein
VAGGINSRKLQDAAAYASGGAIEDNSSTLQDTAAGMVDRLSPIDRNQEVPWPVGLAAESRKTPPLARRGELLGTIALHCKTPPLARRWELLRAIALHCKAESLGSNPC